MSLEYVIQELMGRKLECEEGIKEQQAKVRQAELNLEAVRKNSAQMIEQYQRKITDLNNALIVLESQGVTA